MQKKKKKQLGYYFEWDNTDSASHKMWFTKGWMWKEREHMLFSSLMVDYVLFFENDVVAPVTDERFIALTTAETERDCTKGAR